MRTGSAVLLLLAAALGTSLERVAGAASPSCSGVYACQDMCHRAGAARKAAGTVLSLDMGARPCSWREDDGRQIEAGWACIISACPLGLADLDHDARSSSHRWVEVEAGDYMWLRAFCPQACYAGGPGPFRYLLYKDVNRHMKLGRP